MFVKKRMLISITIYFGLEIERMENFHNDCCRPGTKNLFKNSHSRRWLRSSNLSYSFLDDDDSYEGGQQRKNKGTG